MKRASELGNGKNINNILKDKIESLKPKPNRFLDKGIEMENKCLNFMKIELCNNKKHVRKERDFKIKEIIENLKTLRDFSIVDIIWKDIYVNKISAFRAFNTSFYRILKSLNFGLRKYSITQFKKCTCNQISCVCNHYKITRNL